MVEIEWCSINSGVTYQWQINLERITQALYTAACATDMLCTYAGKTINILFDSGLALPVFDGTGVPDFVYHPVKVYCMGLRIKGFPPIHMCLPKKDLTGLITDFLGDNDFAVPGSDQYYYVDTDGAVKKGIDCLIPRSYYVFRDGLRDVKPLLLFFVILEIITKLGLFHLVTNFISAYFKTYVNRSIKKSLTEIEERIETLEETTERDRALVNSVLAMLTSEAADILKLRKQLGVRLLLT